MHKLLLILVLAVSVSAQTVELSALNYGTVNGLTAAQRDAQYIAHRLAMLGHVEKEDFYELYHYKYTINDSAIAFLATDDSIAVIERYINYRNGSVVECPVELEWLHFVKASPARVDSLRFDGWKGGPWDKRVKAIPAKDKLLCKAGKEYQDAVNDSIRINPNAANTAKKRGKVWAAIKAKKKADKIKAAK